MSCQHLRCHVVEGATRQLLEDTGAVVLQLVGDAKVNELQLGPDHEEVCWLEVTVHNVLIMDCLQQAVHGKDGSNMHLTRVVHAQ